MELKKIVKIKKVCVFLEIDFGFFVILVYFSFACQISGAPIPRQELDLVDPVLLAS